MADVLAEDGKGAPKGVGFEGEDDLYARPLGYRTYQRQIAAELDLIEDVAGRKHFHSGVKREK